jgi:hypothetical protein
VRHRLLIVAVFLLAGAVVNVAVAWGCNRLAPLPLLMFRPDSEAKFDWPRTVPDDWPSWPNYSEDDASVGRTELRAGTADWLYHLSVLQSGLPLRSVEFHILQAISPDGRPPEQTLVAAWQPGTFVGGVLPLRPIWPGFFVNTLFYAAVLWLLIPGPFVLRRYLRVRRGLCPACAYPRGEADVCSECGGALPQRAWVTT